MSHAIFYFESCYLLISKQLSLLWKDTLKHEEGRYSFQDLQFYSLLKVTNFGSVTHWPRQEETLKKKIKQYRVVSVYLSIYIGGKVSYKLIFLVSKKLSFWFIWVKKFLSWKQFRKFKGNPILGSLPSRCLYPAGKKDLLNPFLFL